MFQLELETGLELLVSGGCKKIQGHDILSYYYIREVEGDSRISDVWYLDGDSSQWGWGSRGERFLLLHTRRYVK